MAKLCINKNDCFNVFKKLAESNRKDVSARIKIGQTKIAKLPIYLEIEKIYEVEDKTRYYAINAVYDNKSINLYTLYNEDRVYQVFDKFVFTDEHEEQKEMIKILINEEVDILITSPIKDEGGRDK